jgi:hypothetical protein
MSCPPGAAKEVLTAGLRCRQARMTGRTPAPHVLDVEHLLVEVERDRLARVLEERRWQSMIGWNCSRSCRRRPLASMRSSARPGLLTSLQAFSSARSFSTLRCSLAWSSAHAPPMTDGDVPGGDETVRHPITRP